MLRILTERFMANSYNLSDENNLELMKLESEHARVLGAKLEMAYIIAQRQVEIKRVQQSIDAQEKRLVELADLIGKLKRGINK